MLKSMYGVKVPDFKNTQELSTEFMPVPDFVQIVMSQHIGEPCKPLVSVGDTVKVGQIIGDSDVFISAPIHSSVSGMVTNIDDFTMPNGRVVDAITIETDKLQTVSESVNPPVVNDYKGFVKAIRDSGMVGLGGAGFPTHAKFSHSNLDDVNTLIINAAECEPYITSDYRTIMSASNNLEYGIELIIKYLEIKRCIIGIEANKPKAIEKLKGMASENKTIEIAVLPSIYPQGAEKVLVYKTLNRLVVPEGKLPIDVGVIVSNVTTVAEIGRYFVEGLPLIHKRVSIDGGCVTTPKNVLVPIGTDIKAVIDFCGGYQSKPAKIILGGPMMGLTVANDSFPMLKHNNAILVFDEVEAVPYIETACIRCGECMRACPVRLTPFRMKSATTNNDIDELKKLKVNLCIECGCCSYVCPASQHLVQSHRVGKELVKKTKNKSMV